MRATVIGHRGACGHAPENTLASLARARALGLDWVEFDTRLSADGVPVLLHDETLERTTDGVGPVQARSARELAGLDAGGWFGAGFRGERLPTLAAAVELLVAGGMRANVELKSSPGSADALAAAVVATLRRHWPRDAPPPLLSSFDPACLAAARARAPELPRALLFETVPADWPEQLAALGCVALHCDHRAATAALVRELHRRRLACRVYTVNDAPRAAELDAIGVDAVVSDFPDRLLAGG